MQTQKAWQISLLVLLLGILPIWGNDRESPLETITIETLKTRENEVEQLVKRVLPCTVCVRSANGQGSGSGVVVSKEGLVLTASHVIQAAGQDMVVVFPDGREVKAKPLGANRSRDAGMVQILEDGPFPVSELGKSADLKTNQWCVSLGHAGGFDPRRTPPIRLGRVLNNKRFLTTDSVLIGGDSGGPLFDLQGRLIGIHSNIGMSLSQNNHVPIDAFLDNWDRMLQGETWGTLPGMGMDPNRPVLGIQLSREPGPDGVGIDDVVPKSPADVAGLKPGDIISSVNGRVVESADELIDQLGRNKAGQEVSLKILRDGTDMVISAKLIRARDMPDPQNQSADEDIPSKDSAADTKNGQPKNDDDKSKAKTDGIADLDELLRRARENNGRIRLTPEQAQELQRRMRLMQEQGQTRITETAPDPATTKAIRDWGLKVFSTYQPVVASVRKSVHAVLVKNKQVALATAIDADGRLITKASEIQGNEFQIELEGERREGKLVKVFDEYDLAIVEIEKTKLVPIDWENESPDVQLGTFVASASDQLQPEAIGVVSVLARNLDASQQGFLGVALETAEDGVRVVLVQSQSPADEAGLKIGDVVQSFAGKTYKTPGSFAKAISQRAPGETIELKVRRGDKEFSVQVDLADRAMLARMPNRLNLMNQLGGDLSKRRAGFKLALQHDCPIDPEDCGGPLVDLDGKFLGINIARAGRIKSYAIPAPTVRELLKR